MPKQIGRAGAVQGIYNNTGLLVGFQDPQAPADGVDVKFPHINASGNLIDPENGNSVGGSGSGLTEEQVQDYVGAMVVGGTGITATYNDQSNTLTFSLSDERFTTENLNTLNSLTNLTDTDDLPEGTTNLYHSGLRVRSTTLDGVDLNNSTTITSTDTVLEALGKTQGQLDTKASLSANNTFSGVNTYQKATRSTWFELTFNTSLVIQGERPSQYVVATDNFTLENVTLGGSVGDSQGIELEITQDATGNRLLAINTANFEVGDAGLPVLSTAAGAIDRLGLQKSRNGKWLVSVIALNVGGA